MAAIIATARRLHLPVSHRPPPVDDNQPLQTAPQLVPLALRPSVQAIPAMVDTSTGMAMGLVVSDAPSGAAQVGICACGGGGCSARGNRPLESCHVDRRKGHVILAALTSGPLLALMSLLSQGRHVSPARCGGCATVTKAIGRGE